MTGKGAHWPKPEWQRSGGRREKLTMNINIATG
jgi:hypothetical protein